MVWYGMVWHGMVWYGMVWYGMVWYGMVWYGMVWYGMVWYGVVFMLSYGPVRYVSGSLDEGGDRWVHTGTTETDTDRRTLANRQSDKASTTRGREREKE